MDGGIGSSARPAGGLIHGRGIAGCEIGENSKKIDYHRKTWKNRC